MILDGTEGPTAVSDAAHILGTTPSSLVQRSAQIKKSANSASNLKKVKEVGLKGTRTVGKSELKAGNKSKASVAADPSSSSFRIKGNGEIHTNHSSLEHFMIGATAAQQTQIRMITQVFEIMDADSDGQLSVADVRAYFRTVGRNASDLVVRKWIGERDVDQDGSVSLVEFIASYSQQLDPASSAGCGSGNITGIPFVRTSSSVTEAFGTVCLGNTPSEVTDACMATEEYVQRILDSPSVQSFWSIFVSDEAFNRRVGRLFGGLKLMQSMGFEPEQNGTVLALRDPNGRIWDVLPTDVRVMMNKRLQELKNHEHALKEPSVSNIAAVSYAIGALGDSIERASAWAVAMETILTIAANILRNPGDSKYYQINVANPNFHRRVGKLPGALSILAALGFREEESGSAALPMTADLKELDARRLELEVGLDLLQKRIENEKKMEADNGEAAATDLLTPIDDAAKKATGIGIRKGRVLPPRPTNGATIAAELTIAASVSSKKNSDNTSKIPLDKKNDSVLQEEKSKRLKAETALVHQKSLILDLQSQISELQEIDQKNLTLRQGLTISRLEIGDKEDVRKEAQLLGVDSFAFHDDSAKKKSDVITKSASAAVATTMKDKARRSILPVESQLQKQPLVSLTHPVSIGDTRLHVTSHEAFKKGMYIIIGEGFSAECRKISGFGSILIDKPLDHSHPAGSTIRAFSATEKNILLINSILAEEYVRGLLLDEIIPEVVSLGNKNLLEKELNVLYKQRAMLKHTYTLVKQKVVPTGQNIDSSSSITVHALQGKIFSVSDCGALSSLDFAWSTVDMLNLFEDLAFRHVQATEGELMCERKELLRHIDSDARLRGVTHQLAESRGFASFVSMMDRAAQGAALLSYTVYISMLQPSASRAAPIISVTDKEILLSKYGVDSQCIDLLVKVFTLTDFDEDDSISPSEARASFAQLDGCFTDFIQFSKAMSRVVGPHTDEQRLSAVSYITVRAEYAALMRTLPGGLLLHGRRCASVLISSLEQEHHSPAPMMISVIDVIKGLSQSILDSTLLTSGQRVSTILAVLSSPCSRDLIISALTGRVLIGGCPRREERVLDNDSIDVAQISSSINGKCLYLLGRDGVIHIFDVETSRIKIKRRIIWTEPPPQRAVEGYETFLKWRKASGLDYNAQPGDSDSTMATMLSKARDTIDTSSLLATFVLSLPSADVSSRCLVAAIVVVDNETGLIAVNCAASSGAICIHEPISFRRIYRIKAPGSIGKDLSSALQGISVGEKFRGRQQPQMSEGLVNSMVLWSRRSLLLCTIGASHDLHIISLLTGDSIITLAGHTENISCLSISCSIGLIFTGSLDGNVRVWIADECIPHRLAAFGTFDDPKVHHLEKKVAQPMGHIAGTGMRQILRNLSSRLSSKVRLTPIWRRGKIASFFDGTRHRKEPHVEQHSVGVEVVFENGSVQIYSNRVLLRYPNEAIRAPKGPPLWSEAEVPLVIGHEVAIYEIDPDIAACLCARKMGQPVMASQSYAQCALLLNNLLDSKDDDTTNILEAIGLHTDRTISIFTLIRRVFKYPEKYSNRCDRLLTSHDAPVVNVNFSLVSKLLIAIDMNGVCCVWDPCAYSVILTISTPTGGPAFFGAYPYSLVHRSNLLLAMKGAGVADTDQPSFGGAVRKSSNLSVSSVGLLSVPRSMTSSFPINREVINKAFSIDSKFHSADVTVRGFIYVMRDLSTCCIETSCFRLALVTMDSPEQFMCLPRLSGGRGRNSLTKLQELYLRRGDVLRIVYAVTCSHATLDALNDDLRQYGVLQRGYTSTPSEQIEVICFERPKGWLELTKEYQVMNNTLNVTEKRVSVRSGIIIASTGNNEFRVALDFSNDFIHIKSSQIQMVFHTSDSSISRMEVSNGALSLGSRVQFSVEDAASVPHPMGALEENIVQDTLIISVRCVDSDGALSSSILPLLIGRSSFPLPALEMDLPPCQDTATVLSHSLLDIALTSMGRLSAHMYNIRSMKAAWIGTYCVHQMRVWDAISILNDKPKAVLCMDVVKAFSGLDMSAAAFAADLFLSLSSLRVSPSHPLMVCLDSMLGGQGGALFKDAEDFQHGKSGNAGENSLEILQSLLCMRLGLLPEEICREVQNMGTRDVESILVSLYLALCNGPSMNILHEKIGPLNATILSTAFSCKIDESGVGAGNNFLSAKADENRTLMARLRDRKGAGVLTVHLLQHWLTRCLVGHTAALSVMNKRAVSGLLTDVSAISLPLLMAVKDSPLLPPPTYEQIRRNFPSRVRSAPRGHYTVVTKKPFPPDASPLFHGLKMQIVKSIKPHSSSSNGSTDDGDAVCSFLSWTYNYKKDREHDEDPSLIAAMAQLMQLAAPLQEDSLIIVPSASGVGFVGETGGALSGVIHEWDDTWQPLSVLVAKHKGSFCQGRVDLLRLQATRLLDAIIELHDSGVIIRGLSPSTVILDSTGTKVRLLLLPIAYDMDKTLDRGDSAETIVNEGALTAYIASSQGDDLRLCCIPHQGLDASSAVDLTGSNWDTWSFGSVLFIMAFGHSPLASKSLLISQSKKEDHIYGSLEQKDSSSSAAAILLSLMIPKFDTGMRSRRSSTKYSTSLSLPEDLRGIETEGGEQLLIAEFLQYALENQSRELIFSLLSDITGHSMTNLSAFRVAFCHQAPICGLTDRAASLLWEKMIQILFSRLSLGTSSLLSMRLKLAKLPHDLNLSSAMAFSDEHFGLIVTNQEFEALVNSLSDNLSQKQRSFPECAKKMFKSISGMLEEIQWYGLFQQVLYVTSTCLSVDPHERPPLKDLRRLALFDLSENEIALAKACREAKILMAPYTNTENFFSIMLLEPFSRDLLTLMSQTTSIDHTLIDSAENEELVACMHSNLEKLTSLMGCIEELGSLAVTKANGKCQSKPKADIDLGYFLSSLCVDCQWLSERVVQILALVVESNMISGIALYVLRFISTDAAQRSSDIRLIGGIGRENEKERDTRGLSIGSRLIMRMAKFLEHLSVCLCGLSRDLLLSAVLVEELKRMEHEDADVNTFQSVIDLRKVADGLYSSCLCGVIMLYTGEEAPLTAVGPYGTNLKEAHHQLLKSYEIPIFTNASPTGKIPLIDPLDIPMECRWNAHTCKLFEPILLELVGEDGRGSHRMSIGGEMLSQADKFVDELHTKVVLPSLSAVNVSRRNIMEGSAIGQGVESRGSVFFVNLLRVCRALCGEESSGTGRAKERANLNVVTAMALCLPASAPHTAFVTEGAKAAQRRSGPTAKIPDNDTWQRLHVLLDTRSAIRMYSYFSSPEPAMKSSLLKICCRALGICLHVPADIGLTDPYMSTGLEFTSECWIYNISEILKVKVENADLALSALECLRNMAQRREWMRCWAMFDILPILCFLSRSAGKNVALIRTEAMEVLRLSTLHRPEGTRAMINLRMPHACEIPGAAGPESLSILSAEAADMSFGSTLGEQAKFTDALLDWVSISFPSDVPIQKEDYRNSDIPWIPLFDLATMVSSWIPKLCLTLQISDTESAVKKEKEALSVTVACKQISTVQKILLYACISGHPEALSATISCIWAPSRDPEMSLALGNIEGSGLLSCLDQLTTAGIYVDTFLSLKLQIQIVRSLCQLMIYGNRDLIHSFLDCSIVHSFSLFFQCVVDTVTNVTRLNQMTAFSSEYSSIFSAVSFVWETLLSLALIDDRVEEEIIDSGILQKLAEEWLPCSQCVTLILSADVPYNPFIVRSIALRMIRGILLPKGVERVTQRVGQGTEAGDRHSPSDRLAVETTRWLVSTRAVQRELMTIRSTVSTPITSTAAKKPKNASANISLTARRTAADVLITLAGARLEKIDQELQDAGVPSAIISLTASLHPLHSGLRGVWLQWARGALGPTSAAEKEVSPPQSPTRINLSEDPANVDFDRLNQLAERDMSSSLKQLRKYNGVPQFASDPLRASIEGAGSLIFGASLHYLFLIELSSHLSLSTLLIDVQSAKRPIQENLRPKDSQVTIGATSATGDVTVLIDRMGNLVLAVQALFNQRCSKNGLVSIEAATAMLLDLGLRGAAVSIKPTHGAWTLDFPAFLELYSHQCGLSIAGKSNRQDGIWIPTASGIWEEADKTVYNRLSKTAYPFSVCSNGDSHGDKPIAADLKGDNVHRDMWVGTDDVIEIFRLTGLSVTSATVAQSVRALQHLLPGIPEGKLCFQELLALYKYNLDNPYTKLVEEEGEESDGPEPQRWIDPNPQLDSRYDSAPSASSFRGKRSGESDGGGNTEGDSRSLNFGAKGEVEKSGKGEDVDCQINRDRATGLRSRESPDIGENGMTTGWSLPFGSSYPKASLSIITQEFNRLDLLGEGRLTYLTLKSALELREIQTSDSTVRRWLKENDRGGKGYVDFSDYRRIYTNTGMDTDTDSTGRNYNQGPGSFPHKDLSLSQIGDEDRRKLLKRAFSRYDVDGDGLITVEDLKNAFKTQGRESSISDLVAWVKKRDSSGRGAVSLRDFSDHYQ